MASPSLEYNICKDWCFKFNYANNALKRILELKTEQYNYPKNESSPILNTKSN